MVTYLMEVKLLEKLHLYLALILIHLIYFPLFFEGGLNPVIGVFFCDSMIK